MKDTDMINEITPEAEKKVIVNIPLTKGNEADVYVSVNDRTWLIQRGVDVEVPECVAEVLRNQEKALRKAIDFVAAAKFQG